MGFPNAKKVPTPTKTSTLNPIPSGGRGAQNLIHNSKAFPSRTLQNLVLFLFVRTLFIRLLRTILFIAMINERHYQQVSFRPIHWSMLQHFKKEVATVAECGVLCLKNEECKAFHFEKETKLCTLALADAWQIQSMCQGSAKEDMRVYTSVEGKI